jgi:hypothetical protein
MIARAVYGPKFVEGYSSWLIFGLFMTIQTGSLHDGANLIDLINRSETLDDFMARYYDIAFEQDGNLTLH